MIDFLSQRLEFREPLFLLAALLAPAVWLLARRSGGRIVFSSLAVLPRAAHSIRARLAWLPDLMLGIAALSILLVSRDFTSLMRNQREIRYLITPGNFIYGLIRSAAHGAQNANAPREHVGTDAREIRVAIAPKKPSVFVLVLGETVRAANFSLMGSYTRSTTPELARLDVVAFRNVTSCGTSTEVSVPCMFSQWGREDYDERRIRNAEGLLNVLARAGYAVKWLDNQSGCKGVCQGVGIDYVKIDPISAPDL